MDNLTLTFVTIDTLMFVISIAIQIITLHYTRKLCNECK
jgi:hypothetical protein